MKKILFLLLLLSFKSAFSQQGKIYPKNDTKQKVSKMLYAYEPPKGLMIPENAVVRYFYDYSKQAPVPLVKKEKGYEFSIPQPDSASFIMCVVADSKNKTIDNNNDKGFVIYLKNKSKLELQQAEFDKIKMGYYAARLFGLKITEDDIIAQIENLYRQDKGLKKRQDIYVYYLEVKYRQDKEAFGPEVLSYAQLMEKQEDENDLGTAAELYSVLKMKNKQEEVTNSAIKKFPRGNQARQLFMNEVLTIKDINEQLVLERLSAYQKKFEDTSAIIKDQFYSFLMYHFLNKKNIAGIEKYENLMTDKMALAGLYNNSAWDLTGGDLTSPGTDLAFAEQVSKKSLDILKDRMNHPAAGDNATDVLLSYIGYADTYALIMYKQKRYDMAYQVQDEIYRLDTLGMGSDGRERLAMYMEKEKGQAYTKTFIEQQLLQGHQSAVMINQLRDIYKKLNLLDDELKKIMDYSAALANKAMIKEAMAKYGDVKAFDFSLTNMEGKKFELSGYKGKVVVLDFWATWCGPCRASLPHMQALVNEYKGKDVVFFFVDTWQDGEPAAIKKEVAKFMADNKYSFEVLFDYKNEVVKKYKIDGIPTKIVIDKNGQFLSINSSADNLKALIDNNVN
jgi:thiol-disulfide isomerase/thioredoxin